MKRKACYANQLLGLATSLLIGFVSVMTLNYYGQVLEGGGVSFIRELRYLLKMGGDKAMFSMSFTFRLWFLFRRRLVFVLCIRKFCD